MSTIMPLGTCIFFTPNCHTQKRTETIWFRFFFGAASQICLHPRPVMAPDYCVAAIQLAASNSPPDCCI